MFEVPHSVFGYKVFYFSSFIILNLQYEESNLTSYSEVIYVVFSMAYSGIDRIFLVFR